jgi:hypothetical protein
VRRLPLLLLLPLTLGLAARSDAQIIRRGQFGAEPTVWVSAGAGLAQGWRVQDGTTSSLWEFGNATQYTASIEKLLSGATIGLRGTYSAVPLRYNGADANANVSQLFAMVHVAPGHLGFHTVLEFDAGATLYSSFRDAAGTKLAPDSDADFTFALGYGFGYSMSRSFSVEVVRDITTILHQRQGLSAGDDTSVRVGSTRLVGRLGLGG